MQSALPTCKHHPDEELLFYCNTCNERICEECCQGRHVTHKWKLNKKVAREIRQNSGARCEEIEKMIGGLDINKQEEKTRADIDKIEKTRIEWISTINDIADQLKEKRMSGLSRKIASEELTKLRKMLKFFQKDIHDADDSVAVEMEEELHKHKQTISTQITTPEKELVFKEGTSSPDVIKYMFGDVVEDTNQSNVMVANMSTFTHIDDKDHIYRVLPLTKDEALINRSKDKHIDHVDITGKIIKKLPGYSGNFIILDKDIIFTGFASNVIRRITSSGTESDICSTAPLHPSSICKSYNGGLMVTLCSCDSDEITSDSYGEIHHKDTSGGILRKYTHTEDNRDKLFINPDKITQNINTDLCVVDVIDKEFRSRLVVLSVTSKIRFIYTGQPDMKKKFEPNDVCCDHQGRIISSCLQNHVVFLLSKDGLFLQYLLSRQSPLWSPRCLGLHSDTLWVGCSEGVVRVYKYNETRRSINDKITFLGY